MSPLSPRDVRIQAIYEVGVKVDDVLEVARLETARKEGAHASMLQATQALAAVLKQVDAEVSAGQAELAKTWVRRCYAACNNLLNHTSGMMFAARGAENQAKSFVGMVKQLHDLEVVRKEREEAPPPPPPPPAADVPAEPARPAHVPARTLKEQRLAAAKAEEEAKAAQKKEEAPAPVKRRGRPPKNPR